MTCGRLFVIRIVSRGVVSWILGRSTRAQLTTADNRSAAATPCPSDGTACPGFPNQTGRRSHVQPVLSPETPPARRISSTTSWAGRVPNSSNLRAMIRRSVSLHRSACHLSSLPNYAFNSIVAGRIKILGHLKCLPRMGNVATLYQER